jgi:signal transduction histidine kinase
VWATGARPAAEVRAQVSEPFWRASSGTRRTARGSGMGLAVVRVLIEDAGGSVSYRDGPNARGAEFVVRLPRSVAPTPEETSGVT